MLLQDDAHNSVREMVAAAKAAEAKQADLPLFTWEKGIRRYAPNAAMLVAGVRDARRWRIRLLDVAAAAAAEICPGGCLRDYQPGN